MRLLCESIVSPTGLLTGKLTDVASVEELTRRFWPEIWRKATKFQHPYVAALNCTTVDKGTDANETRVQ